jgi:cholesterol oxidase
VLLTETIAGIPTTAHILGGSVMGKDCEEGVIDRDNRVFGYRNMYICDGSMISANPGVNPSLSITALTERAMNKIPPKENGLTEEPRKTGTLLESMND